MSSKGNDPIDLRNYSNNNFNYNDLPPHMFQVPKVLKNAQNDYPTFLDNVINIYTDGSKSEEGTGCAYVIFQYPNSRVNQDYQRTIVFFRQSFLSSEIVFVTYFIYPSPLHFLISTFSPIRCPRCNRLRTITCKILLQAKSRCISAFSLH